MFSIAKDFAGSNIRVLSTEGQTVQLDVELRDTLDDWFFWCFRVDNAGGQTLKFHFPNKNRVGYFGAAVSTNLSDWHWQYDTPTHNGDTFTYSFLPEENHVFFAHDMVYRPERFFSFAEKCNIPLQTLCLSERGREIPYLDVGMGEETILLTARHHACESTGSYVLEGVLKNIIPAFGDKYRILCVPFVDYDGVIDGDQGKNRNGCDHNRDYQPDAPSFYTATAALRKLAEKATLRYAFDFHSPWHLGERNDTVFIPMKHYKTLGEMNRFSKLFEKENTSDALPHFAADDIPPDIEWNRFGTPCFGTYMGNIGAALSFTLETAYFLAGRVIFTPEKAIATGRNFVRALQAYENTPNDRLRS